MPGTGLALRGHTYSREQIMTTNAEKVEAILYKQAERCETREEALFIIRQLKALREAERKQ